MHHKISGIRHKLTSAIFSDTFHIFTETCRETFSAITFQPGELTSYVTTKIFTVSLRYLQHASSARRSPAVEEMQMQLKKFCPLQLRMGAWPYLHIHEFHILKQDLEPFFFFACKKSSHLILRHTDECSNRCRRQSLKSACICVSNYRRRLKVLLCLRHNLSTVRPH